MMQIKEIKKIKLGVDNDNIAYYDDFESYVLVTIVI